MGGRWHSSRQFKQLGLYHKYTGAVRDLDLMRSSGCLKDRELQEATLEPQGNSFFCLLSVLFLMLINFGPSPSSPLHVIM
ncbi:hypothetical protein V2G26_008992 [Clonostachys chloroleuca]